MNNKQIRQTIRQGRLRHTPYIKVYSWLDQAADQPDTMRAVCVVSKKVNNSAVRRHKYQRWMREIIKDEKKLLPPGLALVLIAKPAINQVKNLHQLKESVSLREDNK